MSRPGIVEFKLAGPKGDGQHPYLNAFGAFIGNSIPLREKDARGHWKPRCQREIEEEFKKVDGYRIDLKPYMASLTTVADALNSDNLALAYIALVLAKLPVLS
jgi:hypothetical protein